MIRATVFVACLLNAAAALAECSPEKLELRGDWGQAAFAIELADDPDERSMGLMHRESMPTMSGMLFVYEQPRRASFWMRNTLIPLDMIFADETGQVTHIHHQAKPLDETPIDGGAGVKFVLEINGGMAQTFGIGVGTELRHPSILQEDAIWPCN
jgi:uncharacterized membrane protein (UPF0127 family)